MEEITGVEAILHLLDGYELPAAAWEPAILAARMKDYDPRWLDQLCFTGRLAGEDCRRRQTRKRALSRRCDRALLPLFSRENSRRLAGTGRSHRRKNFPSETELVLKTLGGKRRPVFWRNRPAHGIVEIAGRAGAGRTRRARLGDGGQF